VPDGDKDNGQRARAGVRAWPPPGSDVLRFAQRELLDADGTAIVIIGFDGSIKTVNDSALHLLNARSLEALAPGSPAHIMLRSLLDHAPRQLVSGGTSGTWQGDIDHVDCFGESLVLRATVAARRDDAIEGGGFIGLIAHDVTRARDEAARLRHRATHDPLTGLANRRRILSSLAQSISAQRTRPGHVAAIFIDVDRLKYVNDALGHPVGDRLLVSAARRLADSVRPEDQVARIGGDEFLVVCADVPDAATALELAERMRRALTGRLRLRQLDLDFSVSIGVAVSDHEILAMADDGAAETLIGNADTAMYEAKGSGRTRCVLFTPEMRAEARERTALGTELGRAITEKQLTIEFQPLFSTVDRRTVGAEALVRWRHPERGPMEPMSFINIAEESGTIGRLGEFVLEQALIETRRWLDHDVVGDDFAVHVNVSMVQLASPSFVNQVLSMLRLHELVPERLVIEARETALLGRNPDVDRTVRAFRRAGVQVAIDNFGTGANALSLLTDVGADILKLDGSLALPSGSTDSDSRIVRAVVLLAHSLGMRVVAERVSGTDQLQRLRSAGCDLVQGNLLGAAGPPESLPRASTL
jgi:diguanylate cyclase (GGDEF)-like protein